MSISIATMGKFNGPPARTAIFTRSGGGGGGIEKKKPIIRINKVRYEKKKDKVSIFIKEIKDDTVKY